MGDADESYDFSETDRFVEKFQEGFELVAGCRLPRGGGKILPGAMPLHTAGSGTRSFHEWRDICSPRPFTMFIAAYVDSHGTV